MTASAPCHLRLGPSGGKVSVGRACRVFSFIKFPVGFLFLFGGKKRGSACLCYIRLEGYCKVQKMPTERSFNSRSGSLGASYRLPSSLFFFLLLHCYSYIRANFRQPVEGKRIIAVLHNHAVQMSLCFFFFFFSFSACFAPSRDDF